MNSMKDISKIIEYPKEGILSKTIHKASKIDITLFCMPAKTKISESKTASLKEEVAFIDFGSRTLGRYCLFSLDLLSSSDISFLLHHNTTSFPLLASNIESVVPQHPEPITAIFFINKFYWTHI